jgi:iron complex outermembrane recepter protein
MAMRQKQPRLTLAALAVCAALASAVHAQDNTQLPPVTVTGRNAAAPLALSGFGDTPATRLPLQSTRIDAERLQELGSAGLAALPLLDASVGDAYNSLGYFAQLQVRGFELDTRFNLRRDGLPISGQTGLDLFNKAAVELLKGASGLQAGTSAPSGLLNLVVKRPDAARLDLQLGWEQPGTYTAALDWARRAGAFGWRLNASGARLDPWLKNSRGTRQALALAGDWRFNADTLLEVEWERSHQSQPSQPGFSLLGNRLPSAHELDLSRNLNDASWRLPVVFDNDFGSLRLTRKLAPDWRLQLQAGTQRARNQDRVAFPFGCSAEDRYDRYCSDGSFDLYDFRSDNERRRSGALRAMLEGRVGRHQLRLEALQSRYRADFERQAYNYAGSGSVFGGGTSQSDPSLTDENTNRREHSREIGLSDQLQWGAVELFAGLRHTRLQRAAVRTDASRATEYQQSFTTPWFGATWLLDADLRLYASAGEGLESEVTPNRARYRNAGQALPALKSRQMEVGVKRGSQTVDWSVAAFQISRPVWSDSGACELPSSCVRQPDGKAVHRGLEAQADLKWSGGGLLGSAMWLKARREGGSDTVLNGLAPVNVPAHALKLGLRQSLQPGLQASALWILEGPRAVLLDHSLRLPSWQRLDLGLRMELGSNAQLWRWRVGVDNALNKRAWKEAPQSFGHSYLFPIAPRTFRLGLELAL